MQQGGDKMVNTSKIKGRMVEMNKTIQSLAPKVGFTPYTLGQQISNKKPMSLETAYVLSEELEIKDNEFAEFFLIEKLHIAT